MSVTLTQLMANVGAYVGAPDDTDANNITIQGVNDAIRLLDSRNWGWALMKTTITFTANSRTYAGPSDIRAPRHMELLDSSNNAIGLLYFADPKSFLVEQGLYGLNASPGDASTYTIRNRWEANEVELDVAPSTAFVGKYPKGRLNYYRETTRLNTGTDILDAPSMVESFVEWQAAAYVAARFQPDKAGYAQQRADRAWQLMNQSDMRDQTADWA